MPGGLRFLLVLKFEIMNFLFYGFGRAYVFCCILSNDLSTLMVLMF